MRPTVDGINRPEEFPMITNITLLVFLAGIALYVIRTVRAAR